MAKWKGRGALGTQMGAVNVKCMLVAAFSGLISMLPTKNLYHKPLIHKER